MADQAYMTGRQKYQRPQALLFADNPGTLIDGYYIPDGLEVYADPTDAIETDINQFLILSDDNRDPINVSTERIELRERMINGRMRSFHIADKLTFEVSYSMLPSRSFATNPLFDATGLPSATLSGDANGDGTVSSGETISVANIANRITPDLQYTTDGGAGGVEILKWYETHPGSFWVYLAYDKYSNFGSDAAAYTNLNKYNQVVEVFFSDFTYSIEKRGGTNYDFWNISFSLEEV